MAKRVKLEEKEIRKNILLGHKATRKKASP